ncbi:hypothetical protein D9O36_15330 [Zobellia amurskyensis]|uniref:Uncharacterized protein n=1 Tax=Zobellia amurskyensis TaxID=248905 RepID=A0A7X2ZVN6_9FLAO|nr:hypothetical protein [Zobellia amurskyensis]MUH37222.1 hypothetical protein [Zobellia amurskyensis]
MKSVKQLFGLFMLTAIYCCAIGMGLNTDRTFTSESSDHSQKESVSAVNAKLYCHTSETETIVDAPSNSTPNQLESSNDLWGTQKISESIFESKLIQYTRFSQNLLISSRKTDIIFPFHYFW